MTADLVIEKAVLGSFILEPDMCGEAIDNTRSVWFSDTTHQNIFTAIKSLRMENVAINLLSVNNTLKGKVKTYELALIADSVASSVNVNFQIRVLQQLWTGRQLNHITNTISARAGEDPFELIKELKTQIQEIELTQEWKLQSLHDIHQQRITELDIKRNSDVKIIGKQSGCPTLDKFIGGFVAGELIVLASRPGMGKTSLAVNLGMEHCKFGGSVMMFSIEMPESQITDRAISAESQISNSKIRNADLDDYDMNRIRQCALPSTFCINDNSRLKIDHITTIVKSMKAKYNLSLVIIDYMQLIRSESKNKNREQEVAYISSECKRMAKDSDVCVLALAQLSREVEKRGDKIPQLSDLRESGSIEQDADVVLFPHRPQYYQPTQDEVEEAELHIAKCRNGQTGRIMMKFQGKTTQYIW